MGLGVALDVGTSGYRSQIVDLSNNGKIISTAITMRHPLPGANIMDHLTFWLENGSEVGHKIIMDTVSRLIEAHGVDTGKIERLAVCGNPAQVSMFENIEVRDLAFAGQSMLSRLNVKVPDRRGKLITAGDIGLNALRSECAVIIPPSIRHEIGADALAMIIKSKLLEKKETCMVTDYGTNAEMGLFHDGELYTGSAAAGPAMEGQAIDHGMLAAPFAISDLSFAGDGSWNNYVLNETLKPQLGTVVDPSTGRSRAANAIKARGITGTGVVAAVALGLESGLITPPKINTRDHVLHLQDGIDFNEHDLMEAGKAMGAIRAGHRTLIAEVGIDENAVKTMYLAGASGTYVDPLKAQTAGMVPRIIEKTVQIGNTSLMMAYDLVKDEETLDRMQSVADSIASKHIMFATSKIFENIYLNELSYWTEAMPMEMYNEMLKGYGLAPLPKIVRPKSVERIVSSDIPVLGSGGLKILDNVGVYLTSSFEGCTGCGTCEQQCPENALTVIDGGKNGYTVKIATEFCLGTACKKCEAACPEHVYRFADHKVTERD
ncbi:methylamine methyltransferase corrinoid protein reductive activase [Methanomassiliicoccus luminyensis]|uniref:methylamine methyltransferase corrinoid protein reductive activase n=1 Tax=Methanomassiliicoccus luminyensis TaxID=1080712 RepID=UPI000372B235|nr:methylamine methyltransferase corrinoid protein reductive activase [Methanomassiliicoccus luminyensis]